MSACGYGAVMAQNTPPGISDLLGLFGGVNPFNAVTKSIGQFQRGVSDFLSAVENFNKTMEQLHGMANRVNSLLDTVEEPIRAFVPQVTRTIKAADAMIEQLSGPIDRVAPGLARLADVLSSPALMSMPNELGEFMGVLSDLARRLQPLGMMAESAGSMFGLRPLAGLLGGSSQPPPPASKPVLMAVPPEPRPAKKAPSARKTATKQAPVKKAAVKKAVAKKAVAKKR